MVKVNHTLSYSGNEVLLGSLSGRIGTDFKKIASVSGPVKVTRLNCGEYKYCHIYFNFWNTGQNTYDVNFTGSGNSGQQAVTAINSNALDIYCRASDNNSGYYYINDIAFYWIYGKQFNNNHEEAQGIPLSVASIWDQGKITIFWINKNKFYAGSESSFVQTWNIAPGNFVGYIQVWKYKIPYYL